MTSVILNRALDQAASCCECQDRVFFRLKMVETRLLMPTYHRLVVRDCRQYSLSLLNSTDHELLPRTTTEGTN